jgi:alpha-ketoglutarate-dependent 2,4-dichlorophenoxyacetate dioxygenase
MALTILPANPECPDFVGEVGGIDLRRPVPREAVAEIEAGMDRFAVLVFRDQRLDDEQQLAFTRNFGPLELATGDFQQKDRRLLMAVNDISNLDRDSKVLARDDRTRLFGLGNMLWHSDSSFKATPAKYSLLSARIIPSSPGGNTEFADMRAAWDAIDGETRDLVQDLVCEHSQIHSRGVLGFTEFTAEERLRFAPVPQRLVRRHPVTLRRSLFLSAHAGAIVGWPVPEARAFLRDLVEHATQRQFVHAHAWRQFDLVMWDNRVVMHRGRRYNTAEARDLHRTTVADVAPTLEQAA